MLKELLLQFIVSLVPVFAFQLWFNKEQSWKGMPAFMGILCGLSMILCMLTATTVFGYEADFRLIPYLIGALYGGGPTLILLTLLYIGIRIPMLDSMWEIISFSIFVVVFVPIILMATRRFQRISSDRKKIKGLLIMSGMMLFYSITIIGFISIIEEKWSPIMLLVLLISTSATLFATWLSIFMIENVREKQQLFDEVKHLSVKYRNEVEKLQQFIDETSFGVIIVDGDGAITHFNEIAKTLLSLKPKYIGARELLGTSFPLVFQSGEGETYVNLLNQALSGEKSSQIPLVSGEKMLLLTTITLRMPLDEQNSGAALIAQDVTELRHLQDEVGRMERLSLVGQMAASITHEIRNPMAVIRGFVQLIQERSPKSHEEYFRIVIEELDRANMIISDFLSLAQNRALIMEPSSLHDIINELVPLLNADANLRGQLLEVSLCEDMPLLMMNNREIKQLFLNLARNGMEAMGNKGSLHISTRCLGDKVELRIEDQGIGIPPEQMKHLFEPFFSTKTQGTGLGLPLCLSIAERHNGCIDVESREGEGTTFIVTFFLSRVLAS
ncbi:signal transduction histidine kinase [Paenibacillus endophyticus]|uniref:histidine kinase n=1 Tax=Paenibacillus endophyticus TaxID=1294268 RepID=A0A7W5C4L6_9BACL|nr:ATP-binding protein [Paenibacillus endophyticus]MBB3150943.1 signal transduction histidine kinase [Paenibacillus endophyticus]